MNGLRDHYRPSEYLELRSEMTSIFFNVRSLWGTVLVVYIGAVGAFLGLYFRFGFETPALIWLPVILNGILWIGGYLINRWLRHAYFIGSYLMVFHESDAFMGPREPFGWFHRLRGLTEADQKQDHDLTHSQKYLRKNKGNYPKHCAILLMTFVALPPLFMWFIGYVLPIHCMPFISLFCSAHQASELCYSISIHSTFKGTDSSSYVVPLIVSVASAIVPLIISIRIFSIERAKKKIRGSWETIRSKEDVRNNHA